MELENAFLYHADAVMPALVRRKHARRELAASKNVETPAEKKIREQSHLFRNYLRLKQKEFEELRASSPDAVEIMNFCDGMTLESGAELIERIKNSPVLNSPLDVRSVLMSYVSKAISRIEEAALLDPLDDPLPGEPLSAFQIIRATLIDGERL